jgi:hypothetical protein
MVLRNARSLGRAIVFGEKVIAALVEKVRANPMFDSDGFFAGRAEMTLGLLYKAKKKTALARRHLTESRRILALSGPSPVLALIEAALAELPHTAR